MKNQLRIAFLAAAALLSGCAKNEGNMPEGSQTPTTQISARAISRGDVGVGTKAPVTKPTLDGKQADVYTTVAPLHAYTGDKTRMFTDAYTRGTMSFDNTVYVGYDAGFSGNSLLPKDGSVRYMYGFYPTGWTRAADAGNTFESLSFTFDGSHDVMCSWMTGDQDVQVKYQDATLPERGEFTFKHLLMRCDVQIQAKDADAATVWGRIKSVSLKDASINRISTTEPLGYDYLAGGGGVSFFKMEGTDAARTYTDDAFAKTAFSDMLPLTVDIQNACYSMIAPMTVDADAKTPELTLMVVSRNKEDADGGKEVTTEVPVSLDQSKFTDNANFTRGYAVTIQLNFRAGAIQAIASAEEWKNGGSQNEDVDGTEPATPKIGDLKNGGIVYEVTGTKYKVISLNEAKVSWAPKNTYVLGPGDGQDETDGKKNVAAMKAYSAAHTGDSDTDTKTTGVFATDFPAAAHCDAMNTGGVTGWYLPARDELMAFSTVFKANMSMINDALTSNGGTAINQGFMGTHRSATEVSTSTIDAYCILLTMEVGNPNGKTGVHPVRCIRAN